MSRAGVEHVAALDRALRGLCADLDRIERWGSAFADALLAGARLLAAGNGGSAAHAQHLTSELVGRYRGERLPLSAIALHAEASSVTALVNDYGIDEMFARQVRAHGRAGDLLVGFSTSGRSVNVLAAVEAARAVGLHTFAFTGCEPNPLAAVADDALCVDAPGTATVQEIHQVALHLLCDAIDARIARSTALVGAPHHAEPARG